MDHTLTNSPSLANQFISRMHTELSQGDWEALYRTSIEWLEAEPGRPEATFMQNIACLFINPPAIIQNKRYLDSVKNKDWKAILNWYEVFQGAADQHNPYFQAIHFILQPPAKKTNSIEKALQEHPTNSELLFLQAISLRDRNKSIEKLKLALEEKPGFPSALYLLGIFSLQMNQVDAAEEYLKQAVEQAPDFLEAHYQLGSLYHQYKPEKIEQSRIHLQRVVELDPEGGAGKDAMRVLEGKAQPQYGQKAGGGASAQRGGMSMLTIIGISLLTVALFSGPIANMFKITNPTIGIVAGLFVFIGLYTRFGRKGKK